MRRGTAVLIAASMMVFGALPGLAREGVTDRRVVDEVVDVVDRPVDRPSDHVVDQTMDDPIDATDDVRSADTAPVDVVDRSVDRVRDRETDRERDRQIDRERDRETDRYRCVDFVTDRHCFDDRHPHVNIRHLIQRLIHAGEWEKLFRLLHRLGVI